MMEYVKMGVMGFLSFLAMGHLVLMIYGLLKEAYTIDVLSVSVIAFLYIAGCLTAVLPRTRLGRSAGLKFSLCFSFLVIVALLANMAAFYDALGFLKKELCGTIHNCPKDIAAYYVPPLIYNIILMCFIGIETVLAFTNPDKDRNYHQIEP